MICTDGSEKIPASDGILTESPATPWADDMTSFQSAQASMSASTAPDTSSRDSDGGMFADTVSEIAAVDEDSPWARKNILCLDGGGVRALSSLLILKRLMEEVEKLEASIQPEARTSADSPLVDPVPRSNYMARSTLSSNFLPCHYFDYIAGTSTGGLIAIMLGRLRVSVDTALEEYKQLSAKVFEKRSIKRVLGKYNSSAKREALKHTVDELRPTQPSPDEQNGKFRSDSIRCRTIVCSMKGNMDTNTRTPFLFRSYNHSRKSTDPFERNPNETTHSFSIMEVAQATTASLFYLKSINLPDGKYFDAAVDLNNPSWEVCNEVRLLHGGSRGSISLVLSIGCGNAKENNSKTSFSRSRYLRLQSDLNDISTAVHERVRVESNQNFGYYRFDVQEGLRSVRLDEWKSEKEKQKTKPKPFSSSSNQPPSSSSSSTLKLIEAATEKYLHQIHPQLHECARALVDRRRQRAQTVRWESFAMGTRYRCPIEGCEFSNKKSGGKEEGGSKRTPFQNRNDLMDHLQISHAMAPPDVKHYKEIQMLLDQGRTNSE